MKPVRVATARAGLMLLAVAGGVATPSATAGQAGGGAAARAATPAAEAAGTLDACALLEPREIQRVLGRRAGPGTRSDAGVESNGAYSSSCYWLVAADAASTPPPPGSGLRRNSYVILNAMRWPAASAGPRSFLRSFHEARASGVLTGELLPRPVGDEALWWGDGLAVVRGDVSFGLSVRLLPARSGAPGAVEEQLARFVLDRLDRRGRAAGD